MPPFDLIVACDPKRVIGRQGRLPWRLPKDMAWLNARTAGRACLVGRKTYEAWPSLGLQERLPIVISRNLTRLPARPGTPALLAASPEQALEYGAQSGREIMVCGGVSVFESLLPRCRRLYLTRVGRCFEGDTYFPDWTVLRWRLLEAREEQDGEVPLRFEILEREGVSINLRERAGTETA